MIAGIYKLKLTIELLSGMHIGGGSENFNIGGADSNVIKDPFTEEPFIPGSSIKGKLRSLLEYKHGSVVKNRNGSYELEVKNPKLMNLFESRSEIEGEVQIGRVIYRDFHLSVKSKEEFKNKFGVGVFTEVKSENKIKRINGTAETPRFIERVPKGAIFEGEIIMTVFKNDDVEFMKKSIFEALKLLELNYLGGSGSRGYGRVKISYNEFEEADF